MADDIIFSGVADFDKGLSYLKDKMREAARQIVTKGSIIFADSMKRQYRPRPGGSQRTSSRTGRTYWAGAPNHPAVPPRPTVRSGLSQRSMGTRKLGMIGIDTWMSETGPAVNYERYPELGTRFITVPFPAVRMGAEQAQGAILPLAEAEWAKAVE